MTDEEMEFNKWMERRNVKDTEREEAVAKDDDGKMKVSLVHPAIIEAIAKVREYGTAKYGDKDNWKRVSIERYKDALLRHTLEFWKDTKSLDKESGMPHVYHMATNLSFIIALLEEQECMR